MTGVYEVVMGSNIAYVGGDGRHFLFGHLFDMRTQTDLTAPKLTLAERAAPDASDALPKISFASLPLADAIKTVHGDGSRVLAVFSDPNCPYCKVLEGELGKLDNVTLYTFLLPWISPDRQAAEAAWARAVPARAHDTAVLDRNLALAAQGGSARHATADRAGRTSERRGQAGSRSRGLAQRGRDARSRSEATASHGDDAMRSSHHYSRSSATRLRLPFHSLRERADAVRLREHGRRRWQRTVCLQGPGGRAVRLGLGHLFQRPAAELAVTTEDARRRRRPRRPSWISSWASGAPTTYSGYGRGAFEPGNEPSAQRCGK